MAYSGRLADRIRERLVDFPEVEEKPMMGGLIFMLNDKMCIGIINDEMMCRIDPDCYEAAVEMHGCRPMVFAKKPLIGYVLIEDEGMRSHEDFEYWINLSLEFNPRAKSSKKKK